MLPFRGCPRRFCQTWLLEEASPARCALCLFPRFTLTTHGSPHPAPRRARLSRQNKVTQGRSKQASPLLLCLDISFLKSG